MAKMKTKKKIKKDTPTKKESKFVDLLDTEHPEIILLYGRNGTGKTSFAATLPKPILFLDVKDKGTRSMKIKGVNRGDIIVFEVSEFDDVYEAIEEAKNPTQVEEYKSIVCDHLTSLTELARNKTMKEEKKAKMSQQLHGFAGEYMKEFIAEFKDLSELGITPMFIAQDRTDNGEGDGEDQLMPENGPGVPPGVSKALCATVRIIGQTHIQESVTPTGGEVKREIQYRLRLGPNPYYITKVTAPKEITIPKSLVDPTYDKLIAIVNGEYKEDKPKKERKKRRGKK